jgi:hypothetical protein
MKKKFLTFGLMLFFIAGFIGVALSYPGRIGSSDWDGDGHGGGCHQLDGPGVKSTTGVVTVTADKTIYGASTRVKLTIKITGFTEANFNNGTTSRGGTVGLGLPENLDNNSLFGLGVNFREQLTVDANGDADTLQMAVIAPKTDGEWKLTVLVANGWNHSLADDDLALIYATGSVTIAVGADILGGIASLLFGEVGFLGILASPIGLAGIGAVIVILAVVAKKRG